MPKFERYLKLLKYKNGVPVDPPEYKQGELIDTAEFPSKEECENLVRYRWIDTGRNICKEHQLVNEEKELKSTDKGLTWFDTGKVRGGNRIIDEHATQCGWELKERWRDTGELVCHGYNKAKKITKEVSYDMGKTWQLAVPPEYKFEDTEEMADDCILQSDAFTYEFEGNTWDGEVYIRAYKRYIHDTLDEAYFKYFIRWDKGEYVVKVENTIRGGALNLKIALRVYSTSGKHTVTIWGCIHSFKGTVKSIVSWGTPFRSRMSYVDHYCDDDMINLYDIDIIADSVAPDKNNALFNSFHLGLHTLMEELPIKVGPYVEELDLSNNPNLIKAPAEEGASKLRKIYFDNCTSLKLIPIYEQMKKVISEDYRHVQVGTFKNCNSLTVLPTVELHMTHLYFDYCTNLSDASGLTLHAGQLSFSHCTNLKRFPKVIWSYYEYWEEGSLNYNGCKGDFSYCGFETFDGDIWNWEGRGYDILLKEAFKGCNNLKKFVGYLPADARPFHMKSLFEGTPLESVTPFFKNVKYFPDLAWADYEALRIFANTNIKTLPNDFFNPEMISIYNKFTLETSAKEMFAGCKQLTNYPILNGNPVWDFGSFSVRGLLIATYMFKDCPLIADLVISPWGGNASYVNPALNIIIETVGTNELPSATVEGLEYAIFKDGKLVASDIGDMVKSPLDFHPVEGVKYTIRFYNKNYTMGEFKIPLFTESVLTTGLASRIDAYGRHLDILKGGVNLYKGSTVLSGFERTSVRQLDPDFFINATEITNGDNAFKECTFDALLLTEALKNITTLTSAAYMFESAKVISDCNVFANNPGLIDAEGMFQDSIIKTVSTLPEGPVNMKNCFNRCKYLTTVLNIPASVIDMSSCFNGCTSLVNISEVGGGNKNMYECFGLCTSLVTAPRILEGDMNMTACFTGCTSLLTVPFIGRGKKQMKNCFAELPALQTAHIEGADNMRNCFWKCTNLTEVTGNLEGVTNMDNCFEGCTLLTTVPNIPASVIDMYECFKGCTSLTAVPRIAEGDISMMHCFEGCLSLLTVPFIGKGKKGMFSCFRGCENLTTVHMEGATDMEECFYECKNLTTVHMEGATFMERCFYKCAKLTEITGNLEGVTTMFHCFEGCTSLTTIPNIPSTVTNMLGCFYKCTSLVTAPRIAEGDMNMISCFLECKNLTTVPFIGKGKKNMDSCFYLCRNLKTAHIEGAENMTYCFYGCTNLTEVTGSLKGVINMKGCFEYCTSLTTIPDIPEGATDMERCFYGCTSLTAVPNIPKSVNDLYHCFEGCTSLTGETPVDENGYKLWERAGKPGYPATIYGRGCFYGCTLLADYDQIPAEWK